MNCVFLSGGARSLALRALLENEISVVAVLTPEVKPNSRFLDVLKVAEEFQVPTHQVNRANQLETLKQLDFDILISCGYPLILPDEALSNAKHAINVHPTLLPKYRGFRSGPYIILNNEKESGVTVHFMTKEMDRGDILTQGRFPLTRFDTQKSHYRKTQAIEPELLVEAVRKLQSGDYQTVPQDESQASQFDSVRTPKDSEIDWNLPLKDLYDSIRACDPDDFPAFFYVEGEKVCIKLWRPDRPEGEPDLI